MRYFVKPKTASILSWLLAADATPSTLPSFPENDKLGLVVAQLVSGQVIAEVLPVPSQVVLTCGGGVPLGRLYFQIPKKQLYTVCPELTAESFGGK
jgi:hypothetical protein